MTKPNSKHRILRNYDLQSIYCSAGTKRKGRPCRTLGAALRSPHLARRLTVEINNKINQTAFGAEPGAGANGHFGFPPAVEPPCPPLSAERSAREKELKIEKIREAIERARKGIGRYLEIMELFPDADVSTDKDFQRRFNGFYRIKQRPTVWYEEYYSYMQSLKGQTPTFSAVLRHLHSVLKRYEPSFSSKLVATIDTSLPIWDSVVLKYAEIKSPLFTSKTKVDEAEATYKKLQEWHERHMKSDQGQLILRTFREMVPEHNRISDLKKIDFVLWQSRAERDVPPDR